MALPTIPTRHQDSAAHRQRIAESVNGITSFQFDDSRVRTGAEITAGVTPVNYAYSPGDMRRYGVVVDGTDQTTNIVNAFTALGTTWADDLFLIQGAKFDTMTVMAALPYKAVFHYYNVFQSGSGYRQQITGIMSRPPDAGTDTTWVILDPHYSALSFNNPRTAGTTSGDAGLVGYDWSRGFFTSGTKGPRTQWQANFTKSSVRTAEYGGKGVGAFAMVFRAPERAGNYEPWSNGMTVASGDYILATNNFYYRATSSGTSTVSPTHTSGSATVGGITWAFESQMTFGTLFYVDEQRRIGTNAASTGITHNWDQGLEDTEDFTVRYSGSGVSKKVILRYRPTDGAAALVDLPYWEHSSAAGARLLDTTTSFVFAQITDARGFQLGTHGRIQNTATNGDTTPSVAGSGRLVLANSGATSITTFDDFLPTQEVELFFTTGNTTLINSASLILKGAANTTPAANAIIVITRSTDNTVWVEKSRNY